MNKFSVLVCLGLATVLTGCQTTKGTVTPLKEGYIAEASVNNGDEKAAQKIALYTAEDKCKQYGKDFYVIEQINQSKNGFEMDDTTSDITNTASQLLLGLSTIEQERTVRLKFDCK